MSTTSLIGREHAIDEVARLLGWPEALARDGLVYLDRTGPGSRMQMLETVREFVAERLAARPDAAEIGRRHARYYQALAEQADRPLRSPGASEGRERLQAEAGNLAVSMRRYLAHDRGPLPHLFRVLWLFWTQQDLEREVWPWVEQLLPAAGALARKPGPNWPGQRRCSRSTPGTTRRRWRPASA